MFYKWGNQGLEKFRLSPRTTARTWQPQDANPHLSPPEFLLVTQLATLLEFAQSLVQSRPGPDHFIVQREMGRYPSHPRRWGGGDWTPAGPAPLLGGDIAPLAAAQQPAPRPAAGMAAQLPPGDEEGLPLAGAAAGSIPGRRSICCCSHCSCRERANCPLQSWTAVSCQRAIMDPLPAGTLSFAQLSAEWSQEERADLDGRGEGALSCILIHTGKRS